MASNDISDVRPTGGSDISISQLPIRGEKRIIPTPIDPDYLADLFNLEYSSFGQISPEQAGYANPARQRIVQDTDFYVTAAYQSLVDYVLVRIPHRGLDANGNGDPSLPAIFRFVINPSEVQIARQTLDGQALARSGWQFGVWGEDSVQITVSGKTAGQYFAFGVTDTYLPFSESYRNLEQLQVMFENNGYWFEGEQVNEGPLAADFTRRNIKMHQDVELVVGNFIWSGMFDTLTINQNAEAPFLMDFTLNFVAWKERFRSTSPYNNLIPSAPQRGHSYSAMQNSQTQQANSSSNQFTNTTSTPPAIPNNSTVNPAAAAVQVEPIVATVPPLNLTAQDASPTDNIINANTLSNTDYWLGVM